MLLMSERKNDIKGDGESPLRSRGNGCSSTGKNIDVVLILIVKKRRDGVYAGYELNVNTIIVGAIDWALG